MEYYNKYILKENGGKYRYYLLSDNIEEVIESDPYDTKEEAKKAATVVCWENILAYRQWQLDESYELIKKMWKTPVKDVTPKLVSQIMECFKQREIVQLKHQKLGDKIKKIKGG